MGCVIDYNETESDYNESIGLQDMQLNDSTYDVYVHRQQQKVDQIQYICDHLINPAVLCFGVIGNVTSVTVLRRKRLRHSFDEVEQSATSGLVCLALSDTAFCAIGLLAVLMPHQYKALQGTWALVSLYYNTFKGPLLNVFLLTSTWLIIVISVGRYLAIADPFNAKFTVTVRHKYVIQSVIFFLSCLVNLPQFFHLRINHMPCHQDCTCYFVEPFLFPNYTWYKIIWHVIGTLMPLVILIYCNCGLLYQVYKSLHGCPHRYSTSKITVILVSIITLFLVLVCPSMILTFLSTVIDRLREFSTFRIAVFVTNTMQSLNFAINFVLYSCISKQFRQMLIQTLSCKRVVKPRKQKQVEQYQMVRLKVQHR